MTAEQIKEAYPLGHHLQTIGVKLRGSGNKRTADRCAIGQHSNGHCPVTVDLAAGLWNCNDHKQGGDVIRWMALERNTTDGEILKELETLLGKTAEPSKAKIVKGYNYTDENGLTLFQVCRFDPKTFRQRHKAADGTTVWGMDGVRRVLYNLPAVLAADEIVIVEGEKDADNLNAIGLTATCNVGGAGKWLDSYTEAVAGKNVIVCPDNDEPGLKHRDLILASIIGKAKTVRVVAMPSPHKDVSDFLAASTKERLFELLLAAKLWRPGADVPLKDMAEMEADYREFTRTYEESTLSLDWLNFHDLRPMIPGEMMLFVGDVAVGKTLWCQNLVLNAAPMPTIMFEMELPGALMFERFVSMTTGIKDRAVEETYRSGGSVAWRGSKACGHFQICELSGLSVDDIQGIIERAELRMGVKPKLVIVDYVGLIAGKGAKRYERVSDVAEKLKVIAKTTNTIVVAVSQRSRPAEGEHEVGLHDAKDSGSLEASAQLAIGAWRDEVNSLKLHLKINKSNKGGSGLTSELYLNPVSLRLEKGPHL